MKYFLHFLLAFSPTRDFLLYVFDEEKNKKREEVPEQVQQCCPDTDTDLSVLK